MGKDGYLYVTDGAAVLLGNARNGVYNRIVVQIEDVFFPARLGVIYLRLNGTYRVEILLTDVSERYAAMKALVNLGRKSYIAQHVSAVYAYAEVVAVLPHLRHKWQSQQYCENRC